MRAPFEFLVCIVVALIATGCGNPSRDEFFASHTSEDGAYRIRYADPPWSVVEAEGTYLRLEVEANGSRFGDVDASAIPPKYLFEADVAPGDFVEERAREERRLLAAGHELLEEVSRISTFAHEAEDMNTSEFTADGTRFHRFVYYRRLLGRGTVRVHFAANNDLRNAEVAWMIEAVQVDPG